MTFSVTKHDMERLASSLKFAEILRRGVLAIADKLVANENEEAVKMLAVLAQYARRQDLTRIAVGVGAAAKRSSRPR